MLELMFDQSIFVGFKADTSLQRYLESLRDIDKQYIADHHAFSTTNTWFTLRQLPDLSAYHGHELHEVTVVMLDGQGMRIGEQAWYVDFKFDRSGL